MSQDLETLKATVIALHKTYKEILAEIAAKQTNKASGYAKKMLISGSPCDDLLAKMKENKRWEIIFLIEKYFTPPAIDATKLDEETLSYFYKNLHAKKDITESLQEIESLGCPDIIKTNKTNILLGYDFFVNHKEQIFDIVKNHKEWTANFCLKNSLGLQELAAFKNLHERALSMADINDSAIIFAEITSKKPFIDKLENIVSFENKLPQGFANFCAYDSIKESLRWTNHIKKEVENGLARRDGLAKFQKQYPLEQEHEYWTTPDIEPPLILGTELMPLHKKPSKNKLTRVGEGDESDIAANDVRQLKAMNCAVASGLTSIALTNPEHIRSMIKEVKGKDSKSASTYIVTLYLPDLNTPENGLKKINVAVTALFPKQNGRLYTLDKGDDELWMLLIEKAYAKAMGGYSEINKGNNPLTTMQIFTGKKPQHLNIVASTDESIANFLKPGAMATSKKQVQPLNKHLVGGQYEIIREKGLEDRIPSMDGYNEPPKEIIISMLYLNHTYTVTESYEKTNKVVLKNPLGMYDLRISIEEFKHYFTQIVLP